MAGAWAELVESLHKADHPRAGSERRPEPRAVSSMVGDHRGPIT